MSDHHDNGHLGTHHHDNGHLGTHHRDAHTGHVNSTQESVAIVSSALDSLAQVLATETEAPADTVTRDGCHRTETVAIETAEKIVRDLVRESCAGDAGPVLVSKRTERRTPGDGRDGRTPPRLTTSDVAMTTRDGRTPPRLSPVMTRGAAQKVRRTQSFPEGDITCCHGDVTCGHGDVTCGHGDVTCHVSNGGKENGLENGTDDIKHSNRTKSLSADPLRGKTQLNSKYDLSAVHGASKLGNSVSYVTVPRADALSRNIEGAARAALQHPPKSSEAKSRLLPTPPPESSTILSRPPKSILRIKSKSENSRSRRADNKPKPKTCLVKAKHSPNSAASGIAEMPANNVAVSVKPTPKVNDTKPVKPAPRDTATVKPAPSGTKPATEPAKPAPSDTKPVKPAPSGTKPATAPAKPAPSDTKPVKPSPSGTKPATEPAKPGPSDTKPVKLTPSGTEPATEPAKPAPSDTKPVKPTPSGTEPATEPAKPAPSGSENKTVRKWKRTGLAVKTSLKFQDAGRLARLKRVYTKLKSNSINYINALAKDNVFEDEDPFILQHFNERSKVRKPADSNKGSGYDEHGTFIIDPAGDLFFFTQGLVAIAMLYNLISSVLRMSFDEFEQQNKFVIFTLDTICDMIYLLDFVVHFRTGYLDDGILVTDIGKIKEQYMATPMFSYDLIAVVPLSLTYGIAMEIYQNSVYYFTSRPDVEASMIKNILIGEAVLRLAKLAKFYSMRRFFESFGSRTNSPGVMRAFCLIVYLLLSIHWVGCLYYCISEYEGFGINDWVFPKFEEDDFNNLLYRKYIRCFYWAFLTLTTIGGPEHPDTTAEYIVTCITFLLGIFIFAAVVGNVGDAITSMNESKTTYQKRADAIKLYMQHHGVPDILQKKVKKWLEYSWTRTQGADEQTLMDALPERLRARIAIQIHVKTLKKVKIFENCEHGLLCELVLKLRPQIFSPGDYICRIGEIGKEMFIISHGKVECIITTNTGERKTVAVLVAGQSFGEIALLGVEGCSRRTADVRAIGYSELLSLSKKALTQALEDYPEARKQLEAEGRNRLGKGSSKQTTIQKGDAEELESDGEGSGTAVTKLINDLKSFDSISCKSKLAALTTDKIALQKLLEDKTRELEHANMKISEITRTMGGTLVTSS